MSHYGGVARNNFVGGDSQSQQSLPKAQRNASGEPLVVTRNNGSMAAYYPPPAGARAYGLPPQKSGSQSTLAIMNNKVSQFGGNSKNREIPMKDSRSTARGEPKLRYSTGMLPPLKETEQSTLDAYPGTLPTLGLNKYKMVDFKSEEKYPNPYKVQRH